MIHKYKEQNHKNAATLCHKNNNNQTQILITNTAIEEKHNLHI